MEAEWEKNKPPEEEDDDDEEEEDEWAWKSLTISHAIQVCPFNRQPPPIDRQFT